MKTIFILLVGLSVTLSLPALSLLEQGHINGTLALGKVEKFDGQEVIKLNMQGWGAVITTAESDWSNYQNIRFTLYSAGPRADIMITAGEKNGNYFYYKLNVNWTGWKTITLPLKDFHASKPQSDWKRIIKLHFSPKGWGIEPNPDAVCYLSQLYLDPPSQAGNASLIPVKYCEYGVSAAKFRSEKR